MTYKEKWNFPLQEHEVKSWGKFRWLVETPKHQYGTVTSKLLVSLSLTFIALELSSHSMEGFLGALHSLFLVFLDLWLSTSLWCLTSLVLLSHGFLCTQLGCSVPTTAPERSYPLPKGWLSGPSADCWNQHLKAYLKMLRCPLLTFRLSPLPTDSSAPVYSNCCNPSNVCFVPLAWF